MTKSIARFPPLCITSRACGDQSSENFRLSAESCGITARENITIGSTLRMILRAMVESREKQEKSPVFDEQGGTLWYSHTIGTVTTVPKRFTSTTECLEEILASAEVSRVHPRLKEVEILDQCRGYQPERSETIHLLHTLQKHRIITSQWDTNNCPP